MARDVDSWRGVVAEFSGIPQKEIADLFAQQVLERIHPDAPAPRSGARRIATLVNTNCSNVVWYGDTIPTTNYAVGRNGVAITMDVIHTTEETAADTLSIFQNPSNQARLRRPARSPAPETPPSRRTSPPSRATRSRKAPAPRPAAA